MNKLFIKSRSFVAFALSGLLVLASAPGLASATLAGENGPIVYVEEAIVPCEQEQVDTTIQTQEPIVIPECQNEVTQVVTTTPTGTNPVVAAEFGASEETYDEVATTATIAPNDAAGNHNIVLATEKTITCEEYEEDYRLQSIKVEDAVDTDYCYYADNEAVIYRVQIDKNGNPLGEPVVVTTVSGPEGASTTANFYYELSYSPDQKNVVGVRFYNAKAIPEKDVPRVQENDNEEESVFGPNYVIERINLASGNVEQLVGPKFDPYMNAGYAQNGAIYFTQLVCGDYCPWMKNYDNLSVNNNDEDWNEDWEKPSSEVWFFAPNATEATQLTRTSKINEYFLSASPDSKTVLVCDPNTSLYYTVSTVTGEVTTLSLEDVENPFLPLFFSPDGKSYLGTMGNRYKQQCGERFMAARTLAAVLSDEEVEPSVAVAALADFKNAVIINGMENPDDWAPIVKTVTTTTTPQVLGTTTTKAPQLQSTGSSVIVVVAAGSFVIVLALASLVYRKQEN